MTDGGDPSSNAVRAIMESIKSNAGTGSMLMLARARPEPVFDWIERFCHPLRLHSAFGYLSAVSPAARCPISSPIWGTARHAVMVNWRGGSGSSSRLHSGVGSFVPWTRQEETLDLMRG
jgi:hypothetical protein